MTIQFIAIVKRVKTVKTKDRRECTIIEASGNMKSDFAIWLGPNHEGALALKAGDRITCTADSKGKERWVENTPVTQLSSGYEDNQEYVPESPYSPLATMRKPALTNVAIAPVKTQSETETSGGAYDRHIENLAAKIADCYRATKTQLPDLSEETIQKLATSVFIQLCRDTF
jgi:hypothetical protein